MENIRRVAETAKLMADAGLIVLVSFISPFRSERDMARGLLPEGEFIEIFVDTPIELCQARDPKGLYARARAGEIKNFTGIDSPYEAPTAPDLHLRTAESPAEDLAEQVIAYLEARGRLSPGRGSGETPNIRGLSGCGSPVGQGGWAFAEDQRIDLADHVEVAAFILDAAGARGGSG